MPSVGMRRSTRVFGARVLRSGRRLWTEPQEATKNVRTDHVENRWTELLEDSAGVREDRGDVCKETRQENETNESGDVEMEERESEGDVEVKNGDKKYGIVYTRKKRKRMELVKSGLTEDKRCGKKFFRKQWRRKSRVFSLETCEKDPVCMFREPAVVVNGSSYECGYWMTCLLTTLLSYMTRVRIGVRRLSKFLLSKPIFDAYSSHGVLFLQDSSSAKNPGICIISGSRSLIPLFSVNFSAIPSFFVHMQTTMHLRSARLTYLLVENPLDVYDEDERITDVADYYEEPSFPIPSDREQQDFIEAEPQISSGRRDFSIPVIGVTKSSLRSFQSRNSRKIQKRRSSMRRKRGRPPSSFRVQKPSGTLAADFLRIKQEGVQFSGKSKSIAKNTKELKSTVTREIFAGGCSVNLLITETDKCYREEGANITLELSPSKHWFLAVKKNGVKKYCLTPEKVMRPSCPNRFTHATIWAVDGGSKLEFFNKQDWFIFKELYKECYDRNMQLYVASVIPVPEVQEVSSPDNTDYKPYVRPDSYITVKDDELTRAMVKKSATYDMDSDDETWLAKLNDELYSGTEMRESVTHESFELIIDAFEKGFHGNLDENLDEKAAYEFCMHLETREVIEAVHNYWIKKRKQKRTALVKIFQLYQPRRIQVIPKSILRKKRSFKRQTSTQVGRGKQRPLLQAITTERDALEQQNNVHKLQEAKAAAGRFEGLAILKRQRAQMLMVNADLATYKALMALRIAEAAQIPEVPETVQSFFLG